MRNMSWVVAFGLLSAVSYGALELPDEPRPKITPSTAKNVVSAELADDLRVVLDLQDGSHIVGRIAPRNLPVTIRSESIGDVKIPLERIRGIQFAASNQLVVVTLQNGDKLQGVFTQESFKLDTVFGKVAIATKLATRLTVASARSGKPPEGCVLWYSFDTDEGERVTDKSGHGNHGQVQGATYAANGKIGGAMQFGQVRAAVRVGNPEVLQLQDFTISVWMKRDSKTQVSRDIADDGELFGYGRNGYIVGIHPAGRLFLSKNGLDQVQSQTLVADTEFHHVTVAKFGQRVVFYIDGMADPSVNYSTSFSFETNAAVGATGDSFLASFLGVIDEVMVFNRVLSPEEVKNLHDSQK